MDFKKLVALLPLLWSMGTWAMEPFVIKDIRVEGIQRTEPGTVFSYLPVKVGDTMDDQHATSALKALFATGFFKDVQLLSAQNVLIVSVQERPSIFSIELNGIKDFPKQQLLDNLKYVGLAEGRIFDKSALEKSVHELKRQYVARGKYAVEVKSTVTDLERNRVAVRFDVSEGTASKIRQINIVGNHAYDEADLLDEMKLSTPGWFTWATSNDQYSKPKLSADLEALRTFYLNSGYMDFVIESTQVSISTDKKDVFITINISEGSKYTISDIKVSGPETVMSHEAIRHMIGIQPGDTFSREAIAESNRKISDKLGEDGYAFANVNIAPEINKEKHEVAFTFVVDPMQRAYIRRINVSGNEKSRDEVIRREFRQMESGWFATSKIKKSKQRVDKLGFFSQVNLETSAVPGTSDQLDVNVKVAEKSTGNFQIGAGYSNAEGVTLMGGITQANLFGTGNYLSTQINTSRVNQVYSVSYTNPYYTDDGISRGFDVYKRRTNASMIAVSQYASDTYGAGVRYGVPISDDETFHYGLSTEATTIYLMSNSPQRYRDYVASYGPSTHNVLGTIGWTRDTRDSAIYTTSGSMQNAVVELGLSGQRYDKLTYQHQWFVPLSKSVTLFMNGEVGAANGYGGKPLPFFKNFYAGGTGSVRGYDPNSLGPRDSTNNSLGGNRRVIANVSVLFPLPGMEKEQSLRLSTFIDGGAVYGPGGQVPASTGMRYAAGVGLTWLSPAGPMQLSWANPIGKQPQDKVQHIQFTLGSLF